MGAVHTEAVTPGSLLAAAARMALPKVRESLNAGPHDLAEDAALSKATGSVAVDLLSRSGEPVTEERVNHLAGSLLETLGRTDEVSLQGAETLGGFRSWLIEAFSAALAPLDEVGVGLRALGIEVTTEEVAHMFVDALTENLFTWGKKSDRLRDVALLLHIEKIAEQMPAAQAGAPPPPVVRAWITVETSPPELYVYNDGPSPIFDVIPTPTLIALDLSGERQAMVGAGPLTGNAATQISPEQGFCWPLEHMSSWGGHPLVLSDLHLKFRDNAGRSWRLAHDRLTELM